jgi:hypothetical protein
VAISLPPLQKRKDIPRNTRGSISFHNRLNFSPFSIPQTSKKNERLIYMAEAHIISDRNYFDGNAKFQEKEDDKVVFLLGGILSFALYLSIN